MEPYRTVEMVKKYVDYQRSGSCGVFALWTTRTLLKRNFSNFRVVFGWVLTPFGKRDHIWIELNNGDKIDPTIVQFGQPIQYAKSKYYYSPEKFLQKEGFRLDDCRTRPWMKSYIKRKIHE